MENHGCTSGALGLDYILDKGEMNEGKRQQSTCTVMLLRQRVNT